MRGLLRVFGLRSEIVLSLDSRGFDKEPINSSFIERQRPRIGDGRLHSLDVLAVGKECNRDRMSVRFQLPDRQGIFVAGKSADGDDFKRSEFIRLAERETNDGTKAVLAESFVVGDQD